LLERRIHAEPRSHLTRNQRGNQAGFAPRAQGVTTVVTTQTLPEGDIMEVPCDYFLFQRAAV